MYLLTEVHQLIIFKRRKNESFIAIVIAIVSVFTMRMYTYAAPVVTLGEFDLVDNGKHLDYECNSNYYVYFIYAVNTWNNYKPGIIRKDTLKTVKDVTVSDISVDSTLIWRVTNKGKIQFNQNVMDKMTADQKRHICMVAIGTALGLGKTNNYYDDAMFGRKSSVIKLSVNDKASYDEAYKKY